ncbi:MAG: hypothetical protein LBE25_08930 [Arthrobacter sp.]|jgi:endonuclease/exonuclease/phosphatase family metal-dependent hydrolase|nr:hypothetical protein [Arthrobacter sp.]
MRSRASVLALTLAAVALVGSTAVPAQALAAPAPLAVTAVAAPAAATASVGKLSVVSAHSNGFSVSWPAAAGAYHYETQYSTRSDFAGAGVEAKWNSRYITTSKQNTTFYLRYRVVLGNSKAQTRSAWSASVKAKTTALWPGAIAKPASKGSLNALTVSWKRISNASSYRVAIADNKGMNRGLRTFTVSAATLSKKITGLNSKDGQPKYVRVYAVNGPHQRASERIEVRPAAPATAAGEKVTVAAQNILCVTCKANGGVATPSITRRIPELLATTKTQNPDILLLNEALNTKAGAKKGRLAPFVAGLKKQGYGLDRALESNGTNGKANRVAYKTAKYTKVKSGTLRISSKGGYAAWVLLKSKRTGKQFYAVSAHLSASLPTTGKNSRAAAAKRLVSSIQTLSKGKHTVLFGGDMNDSQNAGGTEHTHAAILKAGWTDLASAASRSMANYGTYNGLKSTMEPTWGRIDYLYSLRTGGPLSYRNVMSVKKGKIVSKHGSDHNMIVARTTIR